ncbi:hypothetical protein ABKN59_005370 [Abortiporus biennis]
MALASRQADTQLKRLCTKPETQIRALAVFQTVQQKTAKGSGHELGLETKDLSAICAYIASLELKNNDVSSQAALKASGLTLEKFKTSVETITGNLRAASSKRPDSRHLRNDRLTHATPVVDPLIRRLCSKPETLKRAQNIFNTAKLKTQPGSGYEIPDALPGLQAICAYLASEELQNNDVSKAVARTSSCLDPKVFNNGLAVVRTALAASDSKSKETVEHSPAEEINYEYLVQMFKLKQVDFMASCMRDVENTIAQSRELGKKYAIPSDVVMIAVFCWMAKVLLLKKDYASILLNKFPVDRNDFEQVYEVIEHTCDLLAKEIKQKVAALRTQKQKATSGNKAFMAAVEQQPSQSQALPQPDPDVSKPPPSPFPVPSTPRKSVLRTPSKSPSKSAMKPTPTSHSNLSSPSKTPGTGTKRKVAFSTIAEEDEEDEEGDGGETPTRRKRRRISNEFRNTPKDKRLPALLDLPSSADTFDSESSAAPTPVGSPRKGKQRAGDNDMMSETSAPSTPRRPKGSLDTFHLRTPGSRSSSKAAATDNEATPRARSRGRVASSTGTITPGRNHNRSRSRRRDEDNYPDAFRAKRCRPVFLDRRQWLDKGSRFEKECQIAKMGRDALIEKFGDPFAELRKKAIAAGVALVAG